MMIFYCQEIQKDTIQTKNVINQDSINPKTDSVLFIKHLSKDSLSRRAVSSNKPAPFISSDTTSVCKRNIITDITFYDPNNFVIKSYSDFSDCFPYSFIENNKIRQTQLKASFVKHLRSGQQIVTKPFHEDWIIAIIIVSAFLLAFVRTTSKSVLPEVTKFFLFRGTKGTSLRGIDGLFQWQSTILNLYSFLIISLFGFAAASYYQLIPSSVPGIIVWLISLGILISAVTLRHTVCILTGNFSGQEEVFKEYLNSIYYFYRFNSILIFILIVLMFYTRTFSPEFYIKTGIIVFLLMYLIRILRLLIIFINQTISIFYLILYLCALEVLPVAISIKYFAGFF
jgi:hypothetical protein